MDSSQLPTPGRLILENITLLAGSPTAFHTRYGFTLTPTTFSKSGNTGPANAVLHFLISIIDDDVAESLFKPCFPILDRDQERDFRKVVDTRLAILERTKLLPVGCARKSVVAAAGGDKFLDLLWSLSSLALQQACLRHPAYGSVSRMRLLSHQSHSDTASQYSASQPPTSRSSRSLLSGRSSRTDRPLADPSRHRRFLGVGMLSASQQRQKDAEEMRARIDSERIALNRTTEMGQHGTKTWASEADSLRERIGQFEAKLRTLKGQLADMGFDENGVDIRASAAQKGDVTVITETKPELDTDTTGGPLVPSPSGDELGEELKTSPIESTESCSSVDDTGDACEDLAADLSRLLTFAVESEDRRVDVEEAVEMEKPAIPFSIGNSTELIRGSEAPVNEDRDPTDILQLVRVATDELEEVTNRMHEISEARKGTKMEVVADLEIDEDAVENIREEIVKPAANPLQNGKNCTGEEVQSGEDFESTESTTVYVATAQEHDNMHGNEPVISNKDNDQPEIVPNIEDSDRSTPAEQNVAHILEEHNVVVESSRRLQKQAAELSAKAMAISTLENDHVLDDSSSRSTCAEVISKPHWYNHAVANSKRAKKATGHSVGTKRHGRPPRGNVNTLSDVSVAAKAMQNYGSQSSRSSTSRRRKEGTRSLDSINLDLNSVDKRSPSSSGSEIDDLCTPSESSSSFKGTPRSVRFAELPPSYSASRTSDNSQEASPNRNMRSSDEPFVTSVSKALEGRRKERNLETYPVSGSSKDPVIASVPEENAETEGQTKEGTSSLTPKKVSKSSQKPEGTLRSDTYAGKTGNWRTGAVSSQKPPRVQRTRTPHRIVRPKDAVQRSVPSRQNPSAKTKSARSFSTRSMSLDNISSLQKSHSNSVAGKGFEQSPLENKESTRSEKKSTQTVSPKESDEDIRSDVGPEDANCRIGSQASDEDSVDDYAAKKESVQKKLFMTPESAVSSSKATKHFSRFTRRSSTGILHYSNRDHVRSTRNVSGACDVTAVVKDSSVEFPSADEEELLFSPTAKPPLPGKPATRRLSSAGFFAGQTAEWQQSVRAQTDATWQNESAGSRGFSELSERLSHNSGKSSSSGMRSKVQSLRARLAALK